MKKTLILLFFFTIILSACSRQYHIQLQEGNDIIGLNDTYIDEGCLVISNNDDTYTMSIKSNNLDTTLIGEYTIDYDLTLDDEYFTCKRTVIVIDDIPPQATLNPGVDTVKVNTEHIDQGITATDETSEIIISIENNVDITKTGTYFIFYQISDEAGNITYLKRVITVID